MTAVALGAAIFAESRDWSADASKPSRGSATTSGPLEVTYDYQARTTSDSVVLRARMKQGALGHDLQVDSHDGWTSGRTALADGLEVRVPLRTVGEHRFRVTVFDPQGRPAPSATTELTIVRTYASARGIPATHDLAVKALKDDLSKENELLIFLHKGTPLPREHMPLRVRAARSLHHGEPEHIEIEVFELENSQVRRPELARGVGVLRIKGMDLPPGLGLRKGDEINFHWQMDDGCVLTASAELPGLKLRLPERRFYVPQTDRDFLGEKGARLAASAIEEAEHDIERAEGIVGNGAGSELERVRTRLMRQREELDQALDADSYRSICEEARRVRNEIAAVLDKPEHRGPALSRELTELKSAFNFRAREIADADQVMRFDELAANAAQEIVRGRPGFDTAKHQLAEMRAVMQRVLWSDPAFIAEVFNTLAEDSYRAIDPALHDRLVDTGRKALLRGDVDGVRDIVFEMISNRISPPAGDSAAAAVATIMRA
jgi:molecular chaperone DnaK